MILGCVTIGQAPRVDVVPDIEPLLPGIRIVERGALDELTPAEIAELTPAEGRAALVSRLRDGSSAVLDEERMLPLVQRAVDAVVADGAGAVLVLCTGHLPELRSPVPVYTAERLARGAAATLVGEDRLGVLVPTLRQVDDIAARWRHDLGRRVSIGAVDPYTADDAELASAARGLAAEGVDWIFLDCIGYSERMASIVQDASGARALTARGLAARMAAAAVATA
ncbi:AroM family protein [Microbacterium esteraromaticum]|uniref:AroM family protein n=1 Tax=Microbacterium esteraromaticum TaxID=57043 RepID=A0A7D8AK82_9MICO|nr:AroM family protein [Microbacterium esteraromaticum]